MRRWFLSYNSRDLELVQRLETALRNKDPDAKIFFAPSSLRAGGYWLPQLADAIADSTVFVLLVGERGLGPWQVDEYYEARDRRIPVVLLLLEGQPAPGLPFLRTLHWVITPDPASEETLGVLLDASAGGGAPPGELWRFVAPYRGLAAMTEADSDFFFGRTDKTIEVVKTLDATPNQVSVLLGNSGVGKSSLAQAGVLSALRRQGWPDPATKDGWPHALRDSRSWCYLTVRPGAEPFRILVESFLRTWRLDPTSTRWAERHAEWAASLKDGKRTLRELLDATERRYEELGQPSPKTFFLYVDQGEEIYVRAAEAERRAYSATLADAIADDRLRMMMSLRSDFLGALQGDEQLFAVHQKIDVPPLRHAELREIVSRPAQLLSAKFEAPELSGDIARRAAEESAQEAGALPLLSYLLDDMWTQMVERGDGTLRLPTAALELGGVLAQRADAFVALNPQHAETLRKLFAYKLASIRDDGEPTRRRAYRSEFSEAEWRIVTELADNPYRLLSTATPDGGEAYVEVAHEAIFRRWERLREWLASEQEFLAWKSKLESDRVRWSRVPAASRSGALLMGLALLQAREWVQQRAPDLSPADVDFIAQSNMREEEERAESVKLKRWLKYAAAAAAIFPLVTLFGGYTWWQGNTIAKQSVELQRQLARTEAERQRAESNKRQVMDLLENVIFNIAVPLTSAGDGPSQTSLARRASDTAQTADSRGGTSTPDFMPQESGDRDAIAAAASRPSPALTTAVIAVEYTRQFVKANPDDLDMRRLLVVSLNVFGEVKLQAKEFDIAERSFKEALGNIREMLRASPDVTLWRDDLAISLIGLGRVNFRTDNLAQARQYFEEAVAVERQLAKNRPPDRILHNLQVHLGELGDLYIKLQERDNALAAFQERLQIRRRRLAAMPGDSQRLTDVSVALDRVGQLIREQGDFIGSRRYFAEALAVDRSLVRRSANRRDWQENLVFSLTRVGDVDRELTRPRDAILLYEEALTIQRKLAADAADIAQQQTLASLLGKIGDTRRRLREFPAAILLHREELDIRRRLLAREPGNLTAQRNVASALDYLGNALRESGDVDGARAAYVEQLNLDRGIANANPDNISILTDLVWSLNRLGDIDRDASRHEESAKYYEEALTIERTLLARDTDSLARMRALASIVAKLGAVRTRLSDHTTALTLHQEELDLRRKLLQRLPDDLDAVRNLSLALDRTGNVLRDMYDFAGALKYFQEELAVDRMFLARAPQNLTALSDLQWTLNKLSDFVRSRLSDRLAARPYMEEMIGIDRKLVALQPTDQERHRRLREDLTKLATLLLELKDPAAARQAYGEILIESERWLGVMKERFVKTAVEANRDALAGAYDVAGWNAVLAGRAAEAIPHIEAALAINQNTPWNTVNLAHAYLFLGRYDEAIKLYASVKALPRGSDGRTYGDDIRNDFAIFRRLELPLPDAERAARELGL